MALQKQSVPINFVQGLDTKTDDKQVQVGKFLALQNSVFDKQGRLTKRNGFASITTLPNVDQTTLTTLNDNLLATGSNLYAYSQDTNSWLSKGKIQPIALDVQPLVRVSTGQTSPDAAVSSSGLTCLVYVDTSLGYYQISDSNTGQQVVSRTALPATATNPRVFLLGRYFIITFMATVSASTHLQYIAIPIANPSSPGAATDFDASSPLGNSLTIGYDGIVANGNLYIAWGSTATVIRLGYMTSTLVRAGSVAVSGSHLGTYISVTADTSQSTAVIWVSFWSASDGYAAAYSQILNNILAPTKVINTITINRLTSVATGMSLTVFYETVNNYNSTGAYPTAIQTDFVSTVTCTQAGVVGTPAIILRSVGLASKPFIDANGSTYILVTYGETNQPTYFLIDSTGAIYLRLAYSNGGGYKATFVLPSVTLIDSTYYVPYSIKDFLASVNKGTALPSGTPSNAIYTQVGINLAKFQINTSGQYSSQIANALHLTGGQLWEYDGVRPVEHGFQVYPENVASATTTGAGAIAAGTYYYVFTYEWTDNQGNLHRSAPSIPIKQVTTTASSTNTLYVPTLRLTYKLTPNPVRIVGYRYSVAQPVYYQFTSITSPTVNSTTVDYVTITDTSADSSILGQTLLYTTGGVIENIAAPASIHSALYSNRLFLIDAENRNLLWYSKQVIENTPVEMSDLQTVYVAPTTGAQGSTGPMTALSAMDDKLIIFKSSALYYMTGNGPDITGANNDFRDPTYITASVGTDNPASIVLTPDGIMFQSQKGIWLLNRSLQTTYIGAPVEAYNSNTVMSATAIPGTNQVRFILDNNVTLMYDYYYGQWGTFSNTQAISATLYQGQHTYLNSYGTVFQEAPGTYIDGSSPVLLSFTTSWMSLAGLQGFERFYELYLLGTYFTPFKLNVSFSYDYAPPSQSVVVSPDNYTPTWGGEANWGSGGNWGGVGNILEARIFPSTQKCETFQVTVTEIYDSSLGVAAGQGLSLSGLNMIIGSKRGYRTQKAGRSFG